MIFSAIPAPLSATATRTADETQPAASTLRSLLRAGLSRLPTPRGAPVDSDHLSSPPCAPSPLPTVASPTGRLCVPFALPRPIIIQTAPAQPSPETPIRQPHRRRRNERLAVLCQRHCWKVRHYPLLIVLSISHFHCPHPTPCLPPPFRVSPGTLPPRLRPFSPWRCLVHGTRAVFFWSIYPCVPRVPLSASGHWPLAAGIRSIHLSASISCTHQLSSIRSSPPHSLLSAPKRVRSLTNLYSRMTPIPPSAWTGCAINPSPSSSADITAADVVT